MRIPTTHPRRASLLRRELLEEGVALGITSLNGLIAHGRGEAFDYLLGEKTRGFAIDATYEAAIYLLLAKHPVISVNGNTAALVPNELVELSKILNAPLEINLFHASVKRVDNIRKHLENKGATLILTPSRQSVLPLLNSPRKYVNPRGILIADVVFVPLEDGDRAHALVQNRKKVITVDLNPLSRTATTASVTIVDNLVRVMPLLIEKIKSMQKEKRGTFALKSTYSNKKILERAVYFLRASV